MLNIFELQPTEDPTQILDNLLAAERTQSGQMLPKGQWGDEEEPDEIKNVSDRGGDAEDGQKHHKTPTRPPPAKSLDELRAEVAEENNVWS